MYKVTKQFGLARRSGTFLLDAGVPPWRDGQTKVQLWLNVPELADKRNAFIFLIYAIVVWFTLINAHKSCQKSKLPLYVFKPIRTK